MLYLEQKEEELEISRERHNIDEIPEGLNINMLIREQHGEYMDNLIGGTLGKILKEEQPELYEKIQKRKYLGSYKWRNYAR